MKHSSKTLLFVFCTLAASATFAGCGDDDDAATPANQGGEPGSGNGSQAGAAGQPEDVNQAGGSNLPGNGEAGSTAAGGSSGNGGAAGNASVAGSVGTNGGADTGVGGSDVGAAGMDGAAGAATTLMCTQIKYGAGVSADYVTEAEPAPLGGDITSGTYQLTKLTHYGSQQASTGNDKIHSAVKLTATTLEWANQGKDEPETRGSFTYTISDTELALTKVCPVAGAGDSTPYTATATTFILYLDAEYTYTKQ